MTDVAPTIDNLANTLEALEQIDSLEHYEAPEVLPNGDVIMRRKDDAPAYRSDPRDDGPRTLPAPSTNTPEIDETHI